METNTYKTNIDGFAQTIGAFDSATETPIYWGNESHPQKLEDYKGIYNMGTSRVSKVVSKNYQIIQHNDVAQAVVETLGELNIDVKGTVNNHHDRIKMDMVFNNQGVPIEDGEKGIQVGIRMVNSYDRSSSFRLEMFGYRLVCQNGMSFGKSMGIREIMFHTGDKKPYDVIKAITEKFIKNVIKSYAKIQEYVNDCMADSIEWKTAEKILKVLVKRKKHITGLMNIIKRDVELVDGKITRWAMYNALTNYISHDQTLKPTVVTYLEKSSQAMLYNQFETLQRQIVEVTPQ